MLCHFVKVAHLAIYVYSSKNFRLFVLNTNQTLIPYCVDGNALFLPSSLSLSRWLRFFTILDTFIRFHPHQIRDSSVCVFKSQYAMQMALQYECKQTMFGWASGAGANLNEFKRACIHTHTHTFTASNVNLILCIISIETNL